MAGIKADEWFKQDYIPVVPNDDDDDDDGAYNLALSIKEVVEISMAF